MSNRDRAELYVQDIIAPASVEHLYEYGIPDAAGHFGYIYNFLDYHFVENGRAVGARHYLHDPGSVSVYCDVGEVDDLTMRVMVFLLMRYQNLQWLEQDGYKPVPEDIMAKVRHRMEQHMAEQAGPPSP
jgi:hypothetical protein